MSLLRLPSRVISFAAKLDPGRKPIDCGAEEELVFDDRPRNGEGQFEPQADGAPDPATMRAAYGPRLGAATAATGAVAGPGGTAAAAALLAKKLKSTGFGA